MRLGIMLAMQITKTIESCTKRNYCNQVTNGKHISSSPFQDFSEEMIYVIGAMNSPQEAKPPVTRQCEVAPKIIITNICSKFKSSKEYYSEENT